MTARNNLRESAAVIDGNLFIRLAVVLSLAALLAATVVPAAEAETRGAAVEKDLRTLEVVLDNLLVQPGGNPFMGSPFGDNCRGIYLEGYGVLFYACRSMPFQSFLGYRSSADNPVMRDMSRFGISGNRPDNLGPTGKRSGRSSPVSDLEQNQIRSHLNEFFGNYAPGFTSLEPDDRVSVLVQIEGPFMNRGTTPYLFASMKGGDLKKLEQARNPVNEADKRLDFDTVDRDENGRDRSLHIMSQILAANLDLGDVSAVYLDDFGVLFMAENGHFPMGLGSSGLDLFGDVESSNTVEEVRRTGPDSTITFFQRYQQAVVDLKPDSARMAAKAERIKDAFVDALVKYGRTLEQLKRNDRLVFVVNTQVLFGSGPRGLQVYVDNADLNEYRRERIDRDQLMDRAIVRYF